jgi:hypothetical protein
MFCCAVAVLGLIGPRALIVFWWLFDGSHWSAVFGSLILPLLGLLFLPWTTLVYVLVWSAGGLSPFGWLLVALAFLADIGFYGGGAARRRRAAAH